MKRTLVLLVPLLLLFGCKNEPKIEYKYSDQEDLFMCSSADMDLIKEAVYVFEDYISKNYAFLSKQPPEGYHNYIELLYDDRSPAKEFFSPHLIKFTEYIKNQNDLWVEIDGQLKLNYDHELVTCIVNNIKDEQLRNTIDVLITSNTVKPQVLGPIMMRNKQMMQEDRALATYLVLETFYPKLFYMNSPDFVENADKLNNKDELDPANLERLNINDTIPN